jgi:hypothetical protein
MFNRRLLALQRSTAKRPPGSCAPRVYIHLHSVLQVLELEH